MFNNTASLRAQYDLFLQIELLLSPHPRLQRTRRKLPLIWTLDKRKSRITPITLHHPSLPQSPKNIATNFLSLPLPSPSSQQKHLDEALRKALPPGARAPVLSFSTDRFSFVRQGRSAAFFGPAAPFGPCADRARACRTHRWMCAHPVTPQTRSASARLASGKGTKVPNRCCCSHARCR